MRNPLTDDRPVPLAVSLLGLGIVGAVTGCSVGFGQGGAVMTAGAIIGALVAVTLGWWWETRKRPNDGG